MKKLSLIILSFIIILALISCQKKESIDDPKEFETGDIVEYNGVIYEYMDYDDIPMTYQDNLEYVFEEEEDYKAFYHTYYLDMSDYKSQPNLRESIREQGWDKFLEDNCIIISPTMPYAFHVRFAYHDFFSRLYTQSSFIVKGYTDDLPEDVIIPRSIHGYSISQIGYRAFENAPMKTLTWESNRASVVNYFLVHPYAISNCENLRELSFDTGYGAIMSMGISNCNNLEKVERIIPTVDCSFYNLPKLKEVYGLNLIIDFNEKPIFSTYYGLGGGIRKSFFYNCPRIETVTNENKKIGIANNTVYFDMGLNNPIPIYVFDDFVAIINDGFFTHSKDKGLPLCTVMYNPETLEAYVPLLNDGLNKEGTFLFLHRYQDASSVIEDETGIYINAIYEDESYNNKLLFQRK